MAVDEVDSARLGPEVLSNPSVERSTGSLGIPSQTREPSGARVIQRDVGGVLERPPGRDGALTTAADCLEQSERGLIAE